MTQGTFGRDPVLSTHTSTTNINVHHAHQRQKRNFAFDALHPTAELWQQEIQPKKIT